MFEFIATVLGVSVFVQLLLLSAPGDPIDLPPLEHESSPRKPDTRKSNYTWVYHCTSLFNKVYVTENHIISNSIIGRFVDVEKVRRIHVDKSRNTLLDVLFNDNRTLWAEFTAEGRELLQNTVNDNT